MITEADARMLIDKLLEAAGWTITNKAQVSTEEASSDGRADYLLKNCRTRPPAVIEAKRFAVDPYTAKEQACDYAQFLGAPLIILSNGQEHYFGDYVDGDARPINCWNAAKKDGRPTFEYGIQRSINDGFLSNYRIYHAESVLTYEGAQWEGEEIKPGAWGRDVESEDRLKTIIQEYFAADAEWVEERPRKTIVFAVSEKQASILARLFNRLLTDEDCFRIAHQTNRSPSQVRQEYAKKITCYTNNGNLRPIIDQFKYDPLPLVAGARIFQSGLSLEELTHLIEKAEREIYEASNGQVGTKEYRHNFPNERVRVCAEIQAACGLVTTLAEPLNGVVQLITDDGDFATVPGIQVFTANRNVIEAARAHGRLVTR